MKQVIMLSITEEEQYFCVLIIYRAYINVFYLTVNYVSIFTRKFRHRKIFAAASYGHLSI
jgi:hypothetical protein